MSLTLSVRNTIKTTSSLCPICRRQIDAEVYERNGGVYLHKTCTEHGVFDVLINSDRRWYFESAGCGTTCACGGGHDESLIETASTCIALIEIVESCNLKCPTCYADSPYSNPNDIEALPLDEFWSRVGSVIARKGSIDVLQLSGGEPTIHPRFFELLESVLRHEAIKYTLLNTNGVRLAQDDAFMARLGALRRRHGRIEVYLQFDGPQAQGQRELRGADLRKLREKAIERCAEHGIAVTLAMTVNGSNLPHLGDTLRFALQRPAVRGITFQPMFGSGRVPTMMPTVEGEALPCGSRLNVADIIRQLTDQSDGLLSERDFTPLPCGDPNCHTIGYLIRRNGRAVPVSELVDFTKLQGFLQDRVDFNLQDLARCGCENEELGHVLKALEIGPDDVLRLFIKPFMDAWTYDQHRIDRCCVHVIGEGGKLESFCRHYAMRS